MQQTDYLKLHLIEGTDSVDWAPLNENTQALEAEARRLNTAVTTLSANLGGGSTNARIAVGSYVGTGTLGADNPNTLTFDFEPWVVFLSYVTTGGALGGDPGVLLRPMTLGSVCGNSEDQIVTWGENSVSWYSEGSYAISQNNNKGTEYFYLALGRPITAAV